MIMCLIPFQIHSNQKPVMFLPDSIKTVRFEKYYPNDGDPMTIKRINGRLILNIPYQGNFDLYSITDSTFYVKEKENIIHFEYDSKRKPMKIIFEEWIALEPDKIKIREITGAKFYERNYNGILA